MAPGGKAFIIFNFPPGVSFLQSTQWWICSCPGRTALCGAQVIFSFRRPAPAYIDIRNVPNPVSNNSDAKRLSMIGHRAHLPVSF